MPVNYSHLTLNFLHLQCIGRGAEAQIQERVASLQLRVCVTVPGRDFLGQKVLGRVTRNSGRLGGRTVWSLKSERLEDH